MITTTTTTVSALARAESPIRPPPPPPSSATASETSITNSVPRSPSSHSHLGQHPTSPTSTRSVSSTSTRSHRSSTRRSSHTPTRERLSAPSTRNVESGGSARRPGIPNPADIVQPARVNSRKFYVVFSGTRVGIFGDWYGFVYLASLANTACAFRHGQVVHYTKHIPDSHHKSFARFEEALAAYTAAYHGSGPRLEVLPEPEDRLTEDLEAISLSD